MAALLSALQFYPAVGKLALDVSNYWRGTDASARERILQHKIDELLAMVEKLYLRPVVEVKEVGTQTEG